MTLFFVPIQAQEKIEVKVHGELEYEFSSSNADDIELQFQLDKFVIQPKIKIGDRLSLSAQWYARPKGESYLNEFHAKFSNLPRNTYLDFGLFERALKDHHSRLTETYSLYGNAFYRDDSLSVAWGNYQKKHKAPPFYWLVSISEGFKVGHKQPAEQASEYYESKKDKLIQDDLDNTVSLKNPELGFNVGINQKLSAAEVDLMGFVYLDKMTNAERKTYAGYLSNDQKAKLEDDSRYRLGAQANIKIGYGRIFVAYLSANDAGLGRTSYVLEGSYKLSLSKGATLKSFTPVISYSGYNLDGTGDFNIAESWDRNQIILACIIEVIQDTKFKVEYLINSEETGLDIDNNEFLVQLEVKF